MSEQESTTTPGRPLPDLPPENGSSKPLDQDSDSNSGRCHAHASVSKTSFTAKTPAKQKRAIQGLKQSLSFSDHSARSSTASTPHKISGSENSAHSGQCSTHSLQDSTHSAPPTTSAAVSSPAVAVDSDRPVPGKGEDGEEYVSEGEAPSGISVSAILSKLDQVKSYLQEAEALHMQMKQRMSEPGMMAQVSKMGRLVEDLRRQESGYLGILLKLLDQQGHVSPSHVGGRGDAVPQSEELSEDGGSEGEVPSEGEGEEEEEEEEEEQQGEQANDSMSLKAELLKDQMASQQAEQEEQEEELRMLRQQRDILRRLLEQQTQIEALESRKMLQQKRAAETMLTGHATTAAAHTAAQTEPTGPVQSEDKSGQMREHPKLVPKDDEVVAAKLQQLRERQARVEELTTLLNQLQSQTEEEKDLDITGTSSGAAERAGNRTTAQTQRGGAEHGGAEHGGAEHGGDGASELVTVGDQAIPAGLAQLQQKLRQAEEARTKLNELQDMLALLHEDPGPGRGVPAASRPEEEEESESEGELDQSILSEYEERLAMKRQEVSQLQRQRDKLLATQSKLQAMQHNMTEASLPSKPTDSSQHSEEFVSKDAGAELPAQLASELGRQRKVYGDLMDKTQHIQSMVDEVAGARGSQQMAPEIDVTAATWGGSSVPSSEEEEEGDTTGSLLGAGGLDDTRESLQHSYSATLGDSATAVEVAASGGEEDVRAGGGEGGERGRGEGGLVFHVTRHTPRQPRGTQRRVLTPEGTPRSAEKRMKLDMSSSAASTARGASSGPPGAARPAISSYSAVWPGVIFPTHSRKQTKEDGTQTGEQSATASSLQPPPPPTLVDEHISLLHHQLDMTSNVAGQLVCSQQGLISAVCRQLDSLQLEDRIQDHFARLHQYQAELEQYYQELQNVYFKHPVAGEGGMAHPQHQQGEGEGEGEGEEGAEEEDPMFRARSSPQPPLMSAATAASAAAADDAGFGMAPPPPISDPEPATLLEAPVGGQRNETFPHQTSDSIPYQQQMPAMPGHAWASSYGPGVPLRRSSQGPPPGPMAYLPHMYQHQHPVPEKEEGDGVADDDVSLSEQVPGGSFGFAPPPPLAPYFQPSPYAAPYAAPYPSWVPPTPFPNMPPQNHMPGLGHPAHMPGLAHPASVGPSPTFMPGPRAPLHSPYTRYRLSWPPAAFPMSPQYPFHPGYYGPSPHSYVPPGAGYRGLGASHLFNSSYLNAGYSGLNASYGGVGGGGVVGEDGIHQRCYSPSGVTGVSMQVLPPSSPPSAPSISNLHHTSSSLQPASGSGLLHQSSGSTLQAPTTTAPHTAPTKPTPPSSFLPPHLLPASTTFTAHTTHTSTTAAAPAYSAMAADWRGRGERGALGGVRPAAGLQTQAQDEESLSSMPPSLPDTSRAEAGAMAKPPEEFSVFDALRDTIYSEVATLIANNENRPHYLVELFRELQMLSSDYLRQRALYSLQNLVTRYLTEESLQQRQREGGTEHDTTGLRAWVGSEPTPSESLITSEDEVVRAKPSASAHHTAGGGYGEGEESGSPHSTPSNSQAEEPPFAADNLGDTVIRLDKAMARLRESYSSGVSPARMRPPVVSPLAPAELSQSSQSEPTQYTGDINTEQLDEQIKAIMTEVIPLLKENMSSVCSTELLQQIRQLVVSLVLAQEKEQSPTIVETFSKQLDATLHATLFKYLNKMLKECGEAMLVEVSEVLFNELAFFRLMQTMGGRKDLDFRSMTSQSQTTTENEEEGEREGGQVVRSEALPMLQALSAAVAKTLLEEGEALGKSRDDEFAAEWDSQLQDRPSSPSLDGEQTIQVELSASESKPILSVGSGEEDVEEEAATSGSQSDGKTGIAAANPQPTTSGEREETPPTPVIPTVSAVPTGEGSRESASASGGDNEQVAQSPPNLTNVALEVQMKVEQQSSEGIAGILATMEQEQELAGESDRLPQPGPSEVTAEP